MNGRIGVISISILALAAAVSITMAVAAPGDDEPGNPPMTAAEDVARDSVGYAESHGVTQEEAARQGRLEVEMGPSTRALREALPSRFAGIWLEHEPEHRVVAWYTGSEEGLEAVREIAASAPMTVFIKTGAAHTLAELLDAATRAGAQLASGGGIDETTNMARIELDPDSPYAGQDAELADRLEAEYGVPFDVVTNEEAIDLDSTTEGSG